LAARSLVLAIVFAVVSRLIDGKDIVSAGTVLVVLLFGALVFAGLAFERRRELWPRSSSA